MSNRPKEWDPACIKEVAEKLAPALIDWQSDEMPLEDAKEELEKVLGSVIGWDGYKLAQSLESEYGYSPDEQLVDVLSNASLYGIRYVARATKEWVINEKIEPQFKEGDMVKTFKNDVQQHTGPIDSIRRDVAEYVVTSETLGHKYVFAYERIERA